jgi:hypothetical protein
MFTRRFHAMFVGIECIHIVERKQDQLDRGRHRYNDIVRRRGHQQSWCVTSAFVGHWCLVSIQSEICNDDHQFWPRLSDLPCTHTHTHTHTHTRMRMRTHTNMWPLPNNMPVTEPLCPRLCPSVWHCATIICRALLVLYCIATEGHHKEGTTADGCDPGGLPTSVSIWPTTRGLLVTTEFELGRRCVLENVVQFLKPFSVLNRSLELILLHVSLHQHHILVGTSFLQHFHVLYNIDL